MAPFEELYGRKCISPLYLDEVGEWKVLRPDTVGDIIEIIRKIKTQIKEAQDRQKSYADKGWTDLTFAVGDKVFLKVWPSNRIIKFGSTGKLRQRYNFPYDVLERMGPIFYQLALPPNHINLHDVFSCVSA